MSLYIYVLAGVILQTSALQNGDLRLTDAEETTLGKIQSGNKTVIYTCRTKDEQPLQEGNQDSCFVAQEEGHSVLHPVFQVKQNISACTLPWSRVGNGCYRLIQKAKPWNEARQECKRMGGDLAKILDKGTNQGLKRIVPKSGFLEPDNTAWFLANDINTEGQWEYEANQTLTFTGWAKQEPNNLGEEDCALIDESGDWYDAKCKSDLFFLCSKNTVKVRVRCNGTETSLDQCFLGEVDYFTCWDSDKVMIGCTYTHQEEGSHVVLRYRGILQIYLKNQWRFLCDRQFGMKESQVACQQLKKLPHKVFRYSIDTGDGILKEYMAGCDTGLKFVSDYTVSGKGQFRAENTSVNVGCLEMEQCREGFYGDDCRSKCGHCAGGSCSVIDGSCPDGGCEAGYTGVGCTRVMDATVTTGVPDPAGALNERQIGTTNTTQPQKACSAQDTWIFPFAYAGWCLVLLTIGGLIFQFVYFKNKKAKAICPQEEQK